MEEKIKKILLVSFLSVFLFAFNSTEAKRGCCSWHGGVCAYTCPDGANVGYRCCDGTPLSAKCAPYYPSCPTIQSKESPSCQTGYLEEYRCSGNWLEQKYQNSDCTISWKLKEYCIYGCSEGKCKSEFKKTEIENEQKIVNVSVIRVIDGDTIQVKFPDGNIEKVRLIGINAPETVDPRKPVECFGKEASKRLKQLIEGKIVKIEKDPIGDTIDKYGRLLRYVYLGNRNINAEMIKEGYAYTYTEYPFLKLTEFKQYENDARNRKLGLWNPEACVQETDTIRAIKNEILKVESEYYRNPHWFREKLIDKLVEKFKIEKDKVAFYVYTMLPDVK
jgi:micrococcal nuclease